MTFDYGEFAAARAKRRAESTADGKIAALTLDQASVQAEKLTADPAWDKYLSYLQAAAERAEGTAEYHRTQLALLDIVNHDRLMQIKIALAEAQAMAQAWRTAMDLPKEIKTAGVAARATLEKLGIADAAPPS